jgi:hypothetical protein
MFMPLPDPITHELRNEVVASIVKIVRKFDSSALLVMKAHQQNPWKTFIFRSLDVCYPMTVPQDQKASLLQPVEFYWFVQGKKTLNGKLCLTAGVR